MNSSTDPTAVPVSPAATVMLVDDRPDLRVLLAHRTSRVVFGPGSWVFPGGRVDPDDGLAVAESVCDGLSDAEASALLDLPRGGLAWWVAACREMLEEAGILLTTDTAIRPATVAELRNEVEKDESVFLDLLVAHGIRLDVSAVVEVARFITPVGPPRRFDARFFVARAPIDQDATCDNGEIVSTEWIRPAEALERWRAGEIEMMSPTVRMVACLDAFDSTDEVLAVARRRLPYQRVRVIDPDGAYQVVLPGDPGYDRAELEVESGWVRLYRPL